MFSMFNHHEDHDMENISAQDRKIIDLESAGWEFSNWISAHDPGNPGAQCAVMVKNPTRYSTHYCEVNPDGSTG